VALQRKSGLGRLVLGFLYYTKLDTHKPVRTPMNEWSARCRAATFTRGEEPCPLRDSNQLFQQTSGCRPTP